MAFLGWSFWAVAGLTATCAAGLAVLHLLQIRRPQLRVVTTLFWSLAVEAAPARALWQRFRHPWTYALLLSIVVLLALALGRPQLVGEGTRRAAEVVVLDAGMSMAAPMAEGTGLDAAREAVLAEARRCDTSTALAVVVLDPEPRVLLNFGEPACVLQRRLEAVATADAPADRAAGLQLATALVRERRGRVVLVTDRPLSQGGAEPGAAVDTEVVTVGTPGDNAAVLGAVFEPGEADPLRGRVWVQVGYWGAGPRNVRVELGTGAGLQRDETLAMTPGQTRTVVVDDVPADGGEFVVRLPGEDALAADNAGRFLLPRRGAVALAVDGTLPDALRILLSTDPTLRLVAPTDDHTVMVACDDGAPEGKVPTLHIVPGGSVLPSAQTVEVAADQALTAGLALGGALYEGRGLPAVADGDAVLLKAGNVALATVRNDAPAPRVALAAGLFAADAEISCDPALVVLVTRAVRMLAGWDDARVSMPAARVQVDARWLAPRDGVRAQIFAGGRDVSDVSRRTPASTPVTQPSRARCGWAPFEWLLLAGLGLLLAEAVLHARGRVV